MLDHYLLTMDVIHGRLRMHGYLICDDKRLMASACERLGDAAEKLARELGTRIFVPMAMATTLAASGKKVVREILRRHSPEAKELMRKYKDYHFTIWVWTTNDNPDDDKLMALH